MMEEGGQKVHDEADHDVRQLLEIAGPRLQPPAAMEARIRAATLEVWESLPEPRPTVRSRGLLAVAAMIVVALVGGYLLIPASMPDPAGEIEFASGAYTVRGSGDDADRLLPGSIIQTSLEGRLLIALPGAPRLRLDHSTSLTLHSSSEVWLHSGRIYLDTHEGEPVRVVTPFAAVTDVGTQFEVVVQGESLVVATREGSVDVLLADRVIRSKAIAGQGEEVAIEGLVVLSRESIATTGGRWTWTQGARPLFEMRDRSIHEYLAWASRETGRTLTYASDLVRQQASLRRFLGQAEVDADPRSIDMALASANLGRIEGQKHELVVGFRSD